LFADGNEYPGSIANQNSSRIAPSESEPATINFSNKDKRELYEEEKLILVDDSNEPTPSQK